MPATETVKLRNLTGFPRPTTDLLWRSILNTHYVSMSNTNEVKNIVNSKFLLNLPVRINLSY